MLKRRKTMALAYTKTFLVDAFLWRYEDVLEKDTDSDRNHYITMVNDFYDKVGKDRFRVWCSLDADEIKRYKAAIKK